MRRWDEERERSGNNYGTNYNDRDNMRPSDDRYHGDPHRPERGGRSEMRGRMDYERSPYEQSIYDRDQRGGNSPMRREDRSQRESYRGDYGHGGYGQSSGRESYGRESYRQEGYDRGSQGGMRHDDDRRFLYDNDPRQAYDNRRHEERSRSYDRPRYDNDDDWDDRPRISGPVQLDPSERRGGDRGGERRQQMDAREHDGRGGGWHRDEDRSRMSGRDQRYRAEDFEQYQGRDAGFSWRDGSNDTASTSNDRWGSEYHNHSRREGFGWNRGSTRDPHFWSSPDRER